MISHHRIELASSSDAGAISLLSGAAIEHGLRQTWTPQRVLASIRNPATNVAVAQDGAHLIGFGIMDYGEERAHLSLLAVAQGRRRQGVGSALLVWLEESALAAGIALVRAEVRLENTIARGFYGARGYEEGERLVGYYQGLEDALRLEKKLSA
jgi:ribosomal-protein-alanine N-acetyltransferase